MGADSKKINQRFYSLAKAMRLAQKSYFNDRSQRNLAASKERETKLDDAIGWALRNTGNVNHAFMTNCRELRATQTAYFTDRQTAQLHKAKDLERCIDKEIDTFLNGQIKLF